MHAAKDETNSEKLLQYSSAICDLILHKLLLAPLPRNHKILSLSKPDLEIVQTFLKQTVRAKRFKWLSGSNSTVPEEIKMAGMPTGRYGSVFWKNQNGGFVLGGEGDVPANFRYT
jgi:hypothetical protein